MNFSEEDYELIEAYLANELSATDRAAFEADMQRNPDLQAEVSLQRNLRLGLRAIGIEKAVMQARSQYEAIKPAAASVRPLVSSRSWFYWAVAASIVAVLTIGYVAYQQTTRPPDLAFIDTIAPNQSDDLAKELPVGAVSSNVRTQFLDAFTQYKAGRYDRAIEQLRTVPADKQSEPYKLYFLGLSRLANKQPARAIPLFKRAMNSPESSIRQKSEWFLALAYVKNGQNERALPLLKKVSNNNAHPFRQLAQEVLRKID
ncbi:hypothetical protein [Spirosoma montaniterrae]|uniref:Anti-sigma factor n=1 Tax=Spirosoma montaniterrae TaxID=1178516 RepID=A0A1P9X3F1_9BACT|nr:hypothetical protein [Spirosoma montaniterrae]AQG82152.1 hypothetical protein AWR27_24370 [Spirosoma montaniterrae]